MNPWDQHGVRSNQPNLVHCPQEFPVQHSVLNPGALENTSLDAPSPPIVVFQTHTMRLTISAH